MKIQKDMELFLVPTGNIARRSKEVRRAKVSKVGRKYFYVVGAGVFEEKFEIETLKNINADCNSAWVVYFSEQEILDKKEKDILLNKFEKLFSWTSNPSKKLSLEQLREMAKIAGLDLSKEG